jgi:hypothetical protein
MIYQILQIDQNLWEGAGGIMGHAIVSLDRLLNFININPDSFSKEGTG